MSRFLPARLVAAAALSAALVACEDSSTAPTNQLVAPAGGSPALATAALSGTPAERAAAIAERVNARLAAAGSELRLDEAWFFMIGRGTDPFRRLRTGSRWNDASSVTYAIDVSDLTDDVPAADAEQAIVAAFETWNGIGGTSVHATRVADNGGNYDILDGIIRNADGECIDVVDLDADNLISYDPATGAIEWIPAADNVFGGWLVPEYFLDCLGSENIIGVTWTFSLPDGALGQGLDRYRDRLYTEQFYNTRFDWVTTGSVFLGDLFDVQSIVVHEVGHAHGLGHFGGPNVNQPFKLQPNGRVFDPEAVMNPFYIGGEKRNPFPTDIAGLRTMYIGH